MKRMALILATIWIVGLTGALAQNVTVIGPITPGDIPQFSSTTVIKDSGLPASALPTGFANPTGAVGLTAVPGSASTAMRSDAAPPLAGALQSALTGTSNQLLLGSGAFGFNPLGSLGTTTTVLYGNAAGPPSFGPVNIATDVTGSLGGDLLGTLPNPTLNLGLSHTWTAAQTFTVSGVPILVGSPSTSQQALIGFNSAGTAKWQVGKQTDDSFLIFDVAGAATKFQIASNGSMTLMGGGGLVTFGGGLGGSAAASIQASTFGYFDPNPLAQEVLGTTGVRTTGAEANIVLHMASSVGSATGVGAFKANLLTDSVANSGSAPIWSQASVVTLNSGMTLGGITYEADLNVNNQNYGASIATGPSAVNFFATGTHNASHFFGTAAFAATSTGDNFPLWNYGIYLGETGFTAFNTLSIVDKSNSPTSISIIGSRTGYGIAIQNSHATAGDVGILLGLGSASANDTTSVYVNFVNPANSIQRGSITANDSAGAGHVAYNTTSDARLKRDLGLFKNGLELLSELKVHRYQGRGYRGDQSDVGFFAQELYQVYPWAVTPSNDPDYHAHPWQVDYGRITPLLTAAIQDEQHEIDDLRTRLDAVERSSPRKGHHHYAQ